jgi:hypothetical protein
VLILAATAACSGGGSKATDRPVSTANTTPRAAQPSQPPTQPTKPPTRGGQATKLPTGSQPVHLDPAQFSSRIDNPYWPMTPGYHWIYRETDGQGEPQRIEVTVTKRTKMIMGIQARVVHDVASKGGQVVENTFDWYAQDANGNVWYMGEDTKEYENGRVSSTQGSWQAGVDGAQPGILLPAHPAPGMAYRQEYYKGQAEDAAAVLSLNMRAKVPFGIYDHLLTTKEHTPLEPNVLEQKFYAKGIGQVLALTVSGGGGREELIRFDRVG